jgi:hypothetical protein
VSGGARAVTLSAAIERKQPGLPRYLVVPAAAVAAWGLEGTTVVELEINGVALERRAIKSWDADRWFLSITAPDCRQLGVDTGDVVSIRMRVAPTELPAELAALLETDPRARRVWDRLTESRRRMLREEIAAAKQSATRARRARRALTGERTSA